VSLLQEELNDERAKLTDVLAKQMVRTIIIYLALRKYLHNITKLDDITQVVCGDRPAIVCGDQEERKRGIVLVASCDLRAFVEYSQ